MIKSATRTRRIGCFERTLSARYQLVSICHGPSTVLPSEVHGFCFVSTKKLGIYATFTQRAAEIRVEVITPSPSRWSAEHGQLIIAAAYHNYSRRNLHRKAREFSQGETRGASNFSSQSRLRWRIINLCAFVAHPSPSRSYAVSARNSFAQFTYTCKLLKNLELFSEIQERQFFLL